MKKEANGSVKRETHREQVSKESKRAYLQTQADANDLPVRRAVIGEIDAPGDRRTFAIDTCTMKLWDAELISGSTHFRIGKQLTVTYALIVLLGGEGTLDRDGQSCRMRPDTVYVCPPNTTFGMTTANGDEFAVVILRIGLFGESTRSKRKLQAITAVDWLPAGSEIVVEPPGKLADLCRSIIEHGASYDSLHRWRAQLEAHELLYAMMAAAREKPRANTGSSLARAKSYMEQYYSQELTIEQLAGIAEVSPKYFVDLFKKTYGISALDHLTETRMANAKRLMLRSERKLKDIAHEVGYDDEFYFSRKFKKVNGLSPSQFMRRRERKIAAYGSASVTGFLLPLQLIPHAAPLHPKWAGYYFDRYGVDIPYHLDAYRHNLHKRSNLELLAEAKPDLIICPPGLEAWEKERLAAIAETIELPTEEEAGWKTALRSLAEKLGEETEAKRWIDAYERKSILAREEVAGALGEEAVLPLRFLKNRLYASCNQGIADVVYGELGVRRPDGVPTSGVFNHPITLEQLVSYGSVRVLLLVCRETETLEDWKELSHSPEWLSLQTVQEGKLTLIESDPWREYSPVAMERILSDAVRLFSGNRP
ncbi:AraC family transcriptional regulator [Brevibacillus reuszeri]|uniref:AraC family transcriptional regulator n=1 Tax=Brevibacillus reuszeri TaxID=54915 RepID=UPI0028A12800|nr:AraC family transcriptional regulator [Brevibacillus reuszeri]